MACCLASGPSLTRDDCLLVEKWRDADPDRRFVVVVNNTYQIAPWADFLVALDQTWWITYGKDVAKVFKGGCYVSRYANKYADLAPFLAQSNSGAFGVEAACHFGATRIALLGYDCKFRGKLTHWHGSHPDPLSDAKSILQWPQAFKRLKAAHKKVEIVNCSRETALDVFKCVPLEDVLC